MATIRIMSTKILFATAPHTSTSYQISKDINFTDIIDESIKDTVNLLEWNSPLEDGMGGHYKDLPIMYARVKFHFGTDTNKDSEWIVLDSFDQIHPIILDTDEEDNIVRVNSTYYD